MASIERYVLKNGKQMYRVRYRDDRGKTRSKSGFSTKSSAETWRARNVVDLVDGEYIDPRKKRARVADIFPLFLSTKTAWRPSTRATKMSAWEKHIQPRWGNVALEKIDTTAIQMWIQDSLADGLSTSTVRMHASLLEGIVKVARAHGYIKTNPFDNVVMPRLIYRDTRPLTLDQLYAFADEVPIQHRSLVLTLGIVGLRWGEAIALEVQDIDLEKLTIVVNKSAPSVRGKATLGPTKTGKPRVVVITQALADEIEKTIQGKTGKALVWANPTGGYRHNLNRSTWFYGAVARMMQKDPTFPDIIVHDLRHTAASLMISKGVPVLAIQRQLGHASAKMTLDVYGHLYDSDLTILRNLMS